MKKKVFSLMMAFVLAFMGIAQVQAQSRALQTFDFEDQAIPVAWTNDATYPWTVVTPDYAGYNGTYAIRSGNSGVSSSTSSIEVTVDFVEDGSVSFLGGIWGEGTSTAWDKCIFSIDGTQQFAYGALQAWNTYAFDVTAGSHTFTWTYSKDGSVNPTGDCFFVDDVTFTGVAGGGSGEAVTINDNYDFEDNALPEGWTVEGPGNWHVGTGDNSTATGANSGSYNALITHSTSGNVTYLVTPAMDLSNAISGTVNCWYVNRSWAGDIDEFGVYYRVNGGDWNELFHTNTAHSTWTEMGETALTGFAANYQLGFMMYDHYGYGVGVDDIQINITFAGGDEPGYQNGLHTLATYGVGAEEDLEELVDTLFIERPNGAWMEPYHFNLYNDGSHSVDVALIDFLHNNGYFSMAEGTEYPFTVANNGRPGVDLYINTNTAWTGTDYIVSQLAVNTTERSTHLYDILAAPYQPYCPDVWELAYNINDDLNFADGIDAPITWNSYMLQLWNGPADEFELHQNYDLPDYEENIPDGYDAVMKFTVSKAMMLNARVMEGYENGKVALYTEDFGGQPGPMADNNYTERPFNGGGSTGGSGELTVYDGETQVTNEYVPVYGYYADAYLKSEMVYPAVALSDMTGKNINSMKFYADNTNVSWGNASFQVFMKEVSNATIDAYTGVGTVVYEGPLSIVDGEMQVNFTTSYHYNGGNLLVGFYNTVTGSYVHSYWYGQTIEGASVQGYNYSSLSSVSTNQRNFLPKTTFAYGNRSNRDAFLAEGFEDGTMPAGWTVEGPGTWTVGTGDYYTSTGAHTGSYNAKITHSTSGNVTYLVTPEMDLSNATSGTVNCWYVNRSWAGDTDEFGVYYRVNGGAWNELYYTTAAHSTWTEMGEIALTGFAANYQLGFKMYDDYGYGVGLDDIEVNITTAGGGQGGDDTPQGPVFSAGPVIEGLNILPGTYYLVASSTEEDYIVEIGLEELPCPLDHALVVYPEDNDEGIQPNAVTLKWKLSPYCTEYRLVFGSTYFPDDDPDLPSPYTIITDWTSNLAEEYTVRNLFNNTNYFWRIDQRTNGGEENGGCTTIGDVWGFTTKLNIPNLTVTPARIYEGETVTLNWNHVLDRTYRSYRIYKDGELIHTTPVNQVVTSWVVPASELEYNYPDHYTFNVTAVYDEGESDFSNDVTVMVGGYSATNGINGYVYEQDYTTPIVGATVTITGTDALMNQTQTYTATTNANGYYEVQVYEGTYTSAIATMDGYQDATPYQNGPTFYVGHEAHHDNMNFMMDEVFFPPVHVCAQPMYIPGVQGDTLVQVYWSFPNTAQAFEAQIGEGTSTFNYMPYHTLWNNSLATALYRADELTAAGVTAAPMTSLSWYAVSTPGAAQQGITIWMANVSDQTVSANSPLTANMTKVYTGGTNPVTGWNEFVFNEGSFAWDGSSNILIVVQRLNGSWTSSTQWAAGSTSFNSVSYDYDDYEMYNAETTSYSMSVGTTRPNIIMRSGRSVQAEMPRSLHHFNIYRTDCYNDGPYTDENTEFLATAWVPDTSYFDVSWPVAEPGVYKFGVSAVYAGNRVEYPAEERESEIIWHTDCAPCIDKDMQTDITVNVVCNSADSPEGCVVSFTNLNEGEQQAHPQPSITLDDSGFQAINPFRKGDYMVRVYLPGYELIEVEESIWGHRDLRYVLTEIIYNVKNIYVSRTGWAMWDPETWEDYPIPAGGGSNTIIDFETGNFNQYNFDNTIGTYHWSVVQEGQNGGYCMKSGNGGIASSTSAIEASVNYTSAGTISFDLWSRGEGSSDTYDWDKSRFYIDGTRVMDYGAHSAWETFTAEVAAGQHTFRWEYKKDGSVNPTGDCFLVDNINFNIGGTRDGERHLEGFKVMCTSIDGEQIFNHNTPVDQPFCQLSTIDPWSGAAMLIEGEHYLVRVATIYSTGESPWSEPVEWVYEPCDHWGPVDEVTAATQPQGNHIEWVFEHGHNPYAPAGGQGGEADTFSYDFENVSGGNFGDWTTFQGTNGTSTNGWMTYDQHNYTYTNMGHNGSAGWVYSESYITGPNTAVYPDNYLVSPQVNIGSSSVLNFWVTDANDSYGAEHFTVEVSTASNNTAADFTPVFETTLLSKGTRSGRDLVNDQVWYNYSVDLGAYAGQQVYIAFHHFNCYDQWFLALDDVELNAEREGGLTFIQSNGEFYSQYAEDGIMLNFMALDNVDLRAYMLYNITKDNRFSLMAENEYGKFVLTPAYEMSDFMHQFEGFYEDATYNFSLLSKMDIFDQMNEWKNGVASQNFLSITMDVALNNTRVDNDHCLLSNPFCTSEVIEFEAATSSGTADEQNMDDGCIGMSYNPSWYHMRIHDAGQFVIHMEGHDPNTGANRDIDFCMWGPYTEEEVTSGYACTHLTGDKIVDCNYSASYTEDVYLGYPDGQHQHSAGHGTVNYHVPEVGEYYILMITNYSQQPCVINFTKTEGEGETDCDIVYPTDDIIGFLVTLDGEYLAFVAPDLREYDHLGEYGDHEYCVRPIYPGLQQLPDSNFYFSMGCPVCANTSGDITCEPGDAIYGEPVETGAHIYWGGGDDPTPTEGDTFFYNFDNVNNGNFGDWTAFQGGNGTSSNGWMTYDQHNYDLSGYGHNNSNGFVYSESYITGPNTAVNPDNYLVSPQVTLGSTSMLTFYATNISNQYGGEHFTVEVSTASNNTASDFVVVYETTEMSKGGSRSGRDLVNDGVWTEHNVDLSAYAGQQVYIAFHHFGSYDIWALCIDDVELANARNRDGIIGYNIYRSENNVDYALIATVGADVTEYYDNVEPGTYYYQVTALYDGCESDPAVAGLNPANNFVLVIVTGDGENTGLDENAGNVTLFPNPTKGNVTIQAQGMHRITVVSVLGQVVYDTELDQDEFVLNMAQFNTGMYMVRVYTENGMSVKRVTVMH